MFMYIQSVFVKLVYDPLPQFGTEPLVFGNLELKPRRLSVVGQYILSGLKGIPSLCAQLTWSQVILDITDRCDSLQYR